MMVVGTSRPRRTTQNLPPSLSAPQRMPLQCMTMRAPITIPLHGLIRHYGGLCAHPLFWTPRLLELLGCRFQEIDSTSDKTEPLGRPDHDAERQSNGDRSSDHERWESYSDVAQYARSLATSTSPMLKSSSITNLLTSEGSSLKKAWYVRNSIRCNNITYS